MKKKTIIFGSLLAAFLMLMIPNVSAVEYQTVVDANESYFMQGFRNGEFDINALRDKLKDVNIKELRESIQNINIEELKDRMKNENNMYEKIILTIFLILGIIYFITSGMLTFFILEMIFALTGGFLAEFLLSMEVNAYLLLAVEIIFIVIGQILYKVMPQQSKLISLFYVLLGGALVPILQEIINGDNTSLKLSKVNYV